MQDEAQTAEEAHTLEKLPQEENSATKGRERELVRLSESHAHLLSKEGFALYVGKTVSAVVSMAKAGKLPCFYMADPSKPGGNAELWINSKAWDEYAQQLVESAPEEWHGWKDRLSAGKPRRARITQQGTAA